jgi:hypothetical protein
MAQQAVTFGRRNVPQPPRPAPVSTTAHETASAGEALSLRDIPLAYADADAIAPSAGVFGVDETDTMRYIGANWPKYRELWQEMRGGQDFKVSFSFAAFFSHRPLDALSQTLCDGLCEHRRDDRHKLHRSAI